MKKILTKKRFLQIVAVVILLFVAISLIWLVVSKNKTGLSGEGTKENPYQIHNEKEFLYFAEQVNGGNSYMGMYVQLNEDIVMEEIQNQIMIGTSDGTMQFSGIFDGAGHKIGNLNLKGEQRAGLFASLNGIVCNLRIEGGSIEGAISGAIAGEASENALILNCQNTAIIKGETSGGIAGISYGSIMNCTNLIEEETDGAQGIVSNPQECTVWNCYTNKGDFFELLNNTSEEADLKNRENALDNLNAMIAELSIRFQQIPAFSLWNLSEENEPALSEVPANPIQSAAFSTDTQQETQAYYDETAHAWFFPLSEETSLEYEVTFKLLNGEEKKISCSSEYSIAYYQAAGIRYELRFGQETSFGQVSVIPGISALEQSIPLDATQQSVDETKVKIYEVAYLDEKGTLVDHEKKILIMQPGVYTLEGSMNGQLVVDLGETALTDGNAQVTLRLGKVSITNEYGPAIFIRNLLETGSTEQPGARIELADGSQNVVNGSNYMNIYSGDEKSEGAIATNVTLGFYGQDGALEVIGDLEGIETNYALMFQGGQYQIKSSDDAINSSKEVVITGGSFLIDAGDDVIDSNGAISILGGSLMGATSTEAVFNAKDGTTLNGGSIIGSSAYANQVADDSTQGILELEMQELFKKGQHILITDEKETPIFAFEIQKDGNFVAISFPGMIGKTFHFYECSNVLGDWVRGSSNSVESYTVLRQLMQEGSPDFVINDINQSFRID